MTLFDGDYKMTGQQRLESGRGRVVDEAYMAKPQVMRPEQFGPENPPPAELAEFIRPVWNCADCYPKLCECRPSREKEKG